MERIAFRAAVDAHFYRRIAVERARRHLHDYRWRRYHAGWWRLLGDVAPTKDNAPAMAQGCMQRCWLLPEQERWRIVVCAPQQGRCCCVESCGAGKSGPNSTLLPGSLAQRWRVALHMVESGYAATMQNGR